MEGKKTFSLKFGSLSSIVFGIFLFLKLANMGEVANWSWWWVTSPLWIPLALGVSLMLIWLVFYIGFGVLGILINDKRKKRNMGLNQTTPKRSLFQEKLDKLSKPVSFNNWKNRY